MIGYCVSCNRNYRNLNLLPSNDLINFNTIIKFTNMQYSICTTVYNSESIVKEFLTPLLQTDYEIVIVDGKSRDKTYDILSSYGNRINLIQKKCSRGMGRKTAIESSRGDVIVMMDFDIQISSIDRVIKAYESYGIANKIFEFHLIGDDCNQNIFIGNRALFDYYDAWQDVNCMDDIYFEKVCNHFNAINRIDLKCPYKCLKIRNMGAGRESRYEVNYLGKLMRRIKCTSDILFISGFTYNRLLKFYQLKGSSGKIYGLFLYTSARLLKKFIKAPSVNTKIHDIESKSLQS